ncbi:MAG TPA: hypothetical protein VL326_38855 [Kofleriaceae bacterium]|nr:hypothetical protein [Kofleriaceae bacterium]
MRTKLALVAVGLALAPSAADASCVPGFDFAIFAKDGIHIQGNAGTDAWNSTNGTYAATKNCDDADIGTNSSSSGAVYIQSNATMVCGDGLSGAGSNPSLVFTGNGNIGGTTAAQSTNQSLANVTVPPLSAASPFSPSSTNSNTTLTPNRSYGTVSCKNGSLTLSAGTYVVQNLSLTSNCELKLSSGPIAFYFTGTLDMQAGVIANSTGVPANLVFYGGPTATTVSMQGGASAYYAMYAPTAACSLQGNVDMYGAIVCDSAEVQGNAHVHYDLALRTMGGGGFACSAVETSRATPIAATIGTSTAIVQGTFVTPTTAAKTIMATSDIAAFTFPYITGHMRARTTASITTTSSTFSSGTVLFDAAAIGKIPAVNNAVCNTFTGSCRNVFTVTQSPSSAGVSLQPSRVQLNDSNASTIGALIAPTTAVPGITATDWQAIVRKVIAGSLGGVDRSTVAVIQASPLAGNSARPTIAYFGATDGMLHAVCASTGGTTETGSNICPSLGTELWAFMPRVQLPLVRKNTTRIDGSPRVVDAFGDFTGSGQRRFRTILTFQTGYADTSIDAKPAVYALDVTDPANPTVVWEYTQPTTLGTRELGTGLALAVGPTLVNAARKNLVIAETNNGGTGGAGVVVTAIDLETGSRTWQFSYLYPSPPRGDSTALPLPITGIPGGAVGVDLARAGYTTDVVMGDLFGNLWRLDAATGSSRTGTVPLFQFSTNKHPIGTMPAIYADSSSSQYAAFASGGYADPTSASWASGTQKLVAIAIQAGGPYPIAETATARLAVVRDLGTGERGFAQVLVVGTELFATTDSTDVNGSTYGTTGSATGHVVRYNLAAGTSTTVVVRGGAGSLANTSTVLFSSSSDRQEKLVTDAQSTTGSSVDTQAVAKSERLLWLRSL